MSTDIVSGRVERSVKERAAIFIHQAGMTAGDVIKNVWDNIARTGEVPRPVEGTISSAQDEAWENFMGLRASLAQDSANEDWLASLDDQEMRDMVTDMLETKYA